MLIAHCLGFFLSEVFLIYCLILAWKNSLLGGTVWQQLYGLCFSKERSGERGKKEWTVLDYLSSTPESTVLEVCHITRGGLRCSASCFFHAVQSSTLCWLFLYLCHPTSARTIDCYSANLILLLLLGKLLAKLITKPHKHSRESLLG